MTDAEICRWARGKIWKPKEIAVVSSPLRYAMDHELGMLVCITMVAYAECQGDGDLFCGRCRFSVHGCAGAPSRADYLRATASDPAATWNE